MVRNSSPSRWRETPPDPSHIVLFRIGDGVVALELRWMSDSPGTKQVSSIDQRGADVIASDLLPAPETSLAWLGLPWVSLIALREGLLSIYKI